MPFAGSRLLSGSGAASRIKELVMKYKSTGFSGSAIILREYCSPQRDLFSSWTRNGLMSMDGRAMSAMLRVAPGIPREPALLCSALSTIKKAQSPPKRLTQITKSLEAKAQPFVDTHAEAFPSHPIQVPHVPQITRRCIMYVANTARRQGSSKVVAHGHGGSGND